MHILSVTGPKQMFWGVESFVWQTYNLVTDSGDCTIAVRDDDGNKGVLFGHPLYPTNAYLIVSLGEVTAHAFSGGLAKVGEQEAEEAIGASVEILEALVAGDIDILSKKEITQLHQYLGGDEPWPPAITKMRKGLLQEMLDDVKRV